MRYTTVFAGPSVVIAAVAPDNQHPRNVDGFVAYHASSRLPKTSAVVAILSADDTLLVIDPATPLTPAGLDAAREYLHEGLVKRSELHTALEHHAEVTQRSNADPVHVAHIIEKTERTLRQTPIAGVLDLWHQDRTEVVYPDLAALTAWEGATFDERVELVRAASPLARIALARNPRIHEQYVAAHHRALGY